MGQRHLPDCPVCDPLDTASWIEDETQIVDGLPIVVCTEHGGLAKSSATPLDARGRTPSKTSNPRRIRP